MKMNDNCIIMGGARFNRNSILFGCFLCILITRSLLEVDWDAQQEERNIVKVAFARNRAHFTSGSTANKTNRLPPFPTYLKLHHPECISDQKQITILNGKYVYHPLDATAYDHRSCFVMKARYNCAKSNDTNPQELSKNYRYLWKRSDNATEYCDTRAVLEEYAMHSSSSILDSVSLSNSYILLLGTSYLRQIWEAWTCLFIPSVVELRVNEYGPCMSGQATEERGNRLLNISDLGTVMTLDRAMAEGCHGIDGQGVYEKAYAEGVTPRPILINTQCNDDIALTTLPNNLKMAYLFRPDMYDYATLQHILEDRLNIAQEKDMVVVYNDNYSKDTAIEMNSSAVLDFTQLVFQLKQVQKESIQRYFGVDNPWITNVPDSHPCMPGIPDDEAFLLLFSILMGYEIV